MKGNAVLHILAVCVGALAAEGFTRLTIEPDAMFEIAFSPGAQTPSEKYGFVYTPNFDGYMRHPDKVWAVPVAFDEYGFRKPASTPDTTADERLKVVLIGGRSMTMCYGLPDHKTIQRFMVEDAERPLQVHSTGWAGFDPLRSWHYYLDTLDRDLDVDVALFCINPGAIEQYGTLPDDLATIPRHPIQERFFYMMDGNVRMPKDALEDWLGPDYFASYVLYGLLRYRQFPQQWLAAWTRDEEPPAQRGPDDEVGAAPMAASDAETGRRRYAEFMNRMAAHFAERGAKFGVLFLASRGHPVDCYTPFDDALPAAIPRLDLQARLRAGMQNAEFIGMGHYNARHSALIAAQLDAFVFALADE